MLEQTQTLSEAIAEGNLLRVRELVNSSNINSPDENGFTPLQVATLNDWQEIAEFLISKGAEINKVSKFNSPLIYAIINEDYDMVKMLLDKGADVNKAPGVFPSPLYAAVIVWTDFSDEDEKVRIANLLLSRGADVTVRNKEGLNVLDMSLLNSIDSMLDMLELYGATVTPNGPAVAKSRFRTPLKVDKRRLLSAAIQCGHLEKAKEVLQEKPAYINAKNEIGMLPIHEAALGGDIPVIEFLLASGANINQTSETGATPLSIAIRAANRELSAFLRSRGAKDHPNSAGLIHEAATNSDIATMQRIIAERPDMANIRDEFKNTPLHYAIGHDQVEAVKFLLSKNALVDATEYQKKTALHMAVDSTMEILDLIVNAGATLELREENNFTPLLLAVALGNQPAVEYLIKKGANPKNRVGNLKESALHLAVRYGHEDIVKYLLENRIIDVNDRMAAGLTALHIAAKDSLLEIAEILIAHGADVNAAEPELNIVPLFDAANSGDLEMVQLLVEHGANVNAKNRNGNTALMYAEQKEFDDVVEYLKSKGAQEASLLETMEAKKKSDQYVNQVIGEVFKPDPYSDEKLAEKLEEKRPWWKKIFGK